MSTEPGTGTRVTTSVKKLCRALVMVTCLGAFILPGSSFVAATVDNHGIQGIVVGNDGSPINNVQVAICHSDPQCGSPEVTRTNAAGSYYLACCGDGEVVLVWANKDKVVPFWEEKQNVTIPPGINTRARAVFWKSDPSHPISVYLSGARDYYNITNTQADYMPSPPPQ